MESAVSSYESVSPPARCRHGIGGFVVLLMVMAILFGNVLYQLACLRDEVDLAGAVQTQMIRGMVHRHAELRSDIARLKVPRHEANVVSPEHRLKVE